MSLPHNNTISKQFQCHCEHHLTHKRWIKVSALQELKSPVEAVLCLLLCYKPRNYLMYISLVSETLVTAVFQGQGKLAKSNIRIVVHHDAPIFLSLKHRKLTVVTWAHTCPHLIWNFCLYWICSSKTPSGIDNHVSFSGSKVCLSKNLWDIP